jgi:hypothetical protein
MQVAGFASKVGIALGQSVQGAVATWSVIRCDISQDFDSHHLTRSLPLPVLTVSKNNFGRDWTEQADELYE